MPVRPMREHELPRAIEMMRALWPTSTDYGNSWFVVGEPDTNYRVDIAC